MLDDQLSKKWPPLPQINCDLGEGVAWEEDIFPFVDVASLACGGHFGTQESLDASLNLARKFDKKVGAHPSYPDRENFGRVSIKIADVDLIKSIRQQIEWFTERALAHNLALDHIKFHGALYNDAAKDSNLAHLLTDFLVENYHQTPLLVPPHSKLEKKAQEKGLSIRLEVFADRAYTADYLLSSRSQSGSLLKNIASVEPQVKRLLLEGQLLSMEGVQLPIQADTLCFHGDNPGILDFLPILRKRYWT
ncbi:MAG: lactam utilization protein LamB [Bacteroidetes bacterium]|nr:lactam utilization protein LamB [Bacteroidota bacterium]